MTGGLIVILINTALHNVVAMGNNEHPLSVCIDYNTKTGIY